MRSLPKIRLVRPPTNVKPVRPWPLGMGRWRRFCLFVLAAGFWAGIFHPAPVGAKPPLWWSDAKKEDAENYYFIASAEACPTEQAARDNAFLQAEHYISLSISSQYSDPELTLRLSNRPFVGVDEACSPATEHDPNGWTCWIMVSYPKACHEKLLEQLTNGVPRGPRHQVLVAPFAFDDVAVAKYAKVVANYRDKGYGLDLWQTIEDVLEDSADFDPVTRPADVISGITAAIHTGAEVSGDIPEYLLVPNASFFDFSQEELRWGHVLTNEHHHASVHLELYHRENGRWVRVTMAQMDKVDLDELAATNTGAQSAVVKLIERWRLTQQVQTVTSK